MDVLLKCYLGEIHNHLQELFMYFKMSISTISAVNVLQYRSYMAEILPIWR